MFLDNQKLNFKFVNKTKTPLAKSISFLVNQNLYVKNK